MSSKREDLYSLIQSLSKTEKRYFKMEARKAGDKSNSKYIQLFEAIQQMDKYDEEALKKQTFVKNLSMEKAYLSDAILRSLRNFHSEKSLGARMRDLIANARILQDRELYKQSLRQLTKAKKMAYELHDYLSVLEINRMESSFLLRKQDRDNMDKLRELREERVEIMSVVVEENDYANLHHDISMYTHKSYIVRNKNAKESIVNTFKPFLDSQPEQIRSFHARIRFYQSLSLYKTSVGKNDESYEHYMDLIREYDKNPKIRKELAFRYLVSIYNMAQKSMGIRKYNDIPVFIEKMQRLTEENKSHELAAFNIDVQTRLVYYLNTQQFDKAGELADIVKKGLAKYNLNASRRIVFHHNVAVFFFVNQQFEEAREWFGKNLQFKKSEARQDLQRIARIFYLITQIEDSQLEELEGSMRSTQRYFRVYTDLKKQDYELTILNFLKKYYNSPHAEKAAVAGELTQYLQKQATSPNSKWPGLEEISLWAKSKVERMPIIDILTKRL
ncbi:MAG: hypothetical protein AAFV95_11035 [Bacteroidota bacterium]